MDSILTSVKKVLGIVEEYEHFDNDLIMFVNSVFAVLFQLGINESKYFSIKDPKAKWNDYLPDSPLLEYIKSYVTLRVRILFDPPTNSVLMEAINKNLDELLWRIHMTINEENSNG